MNLVTLSEKFPTELDAIIHFEQIRWGAKPKCAYCGSTDLFDRKKDYRNHCRKCKKNSSVTVNTMLEGTHIPLKSWLLAFTLISNAKKGVSALNLQRDLNISYPTAFN